PPLFVAARNIDGAAGALQPIMLPVFVQRSRRWLLERRRENAGSAGSKFHALTASKRLPARQNFSATWSFLECCMEKFSAVPIPTPGFFPLMLPRQRLCRASRPCSRRRISAISFQLIMDGLSLR